MSSKYQIFIQVVEEKSFSNAAKKLGYSQSAVSQSIKLLEEELETKLLIRKREGISLTKDGMDYLPWIRSIATAMENLEKRKKEKKGLINETIRIGTFTSVSRNILPTLLSKFHNLYPRIQFELRQGEYDNIHEWILNGEVDFAFINPDGFDDIHIDVIYQDHMRAVLPKNHPLAKKEFLSLKNLCKDPFILLDEGKNSVPLQAFYKNDLEPKIAYKVYDDYSILAMVKQNMGISMMYELVLNDFENDIETRPIKENVERVIALSCLDPSLLSTSAKKLYSYIKKEIVTLLQEQNLYQK